MDGSSGNSNAAQPLAGDTPLVDWKVAEEVVGGDRELLYQVVDAFLQEAPQQMAALRKAIAAAEAVNVRRAAHTLKGSLRYFGVRSAYELAFQLEQAGQTGDLSPSAAIVEPLESALSQVLSELRSFHARGGAS